MNKGERGCLFDDDIRDCFVERRHILVRDAHTFTYVDIDDEIEDDMER